MKAGSERSSSSRAKPRPMKTTRERWSSSGHASQVLGRVDDVLDAVDHERALGADVQQPFHAQDVVAAGLEQHRQPDPERGPVERLLERQAAPRATSWSCAGASSKTRSRGSRSSPSKSVARRHVAEHDSMTAAAGFSRASSPHQHGRSRRGPVFVTTSRSAAAACLTDSSLAEPVLRVHGRDHALEPEVVLDDRLAEQRVEDRRRVGEARRLDDHAAERGDLARGRAATSRSRSSSARSPRRVQQTQPLSEQRPCARRPAAAGGGRSRPRRAR